MTTSAAASTVAKDISVQVSAPEGEAKGRCPEDVGEKKHHRTGGAKGFDNPWPSYKRNMGVVPILTHYGMAIIKGDETRPKPPPPGTVPFQQAKFSKERLGKDGKLRATWLGHACVFLEFPSGFRALFDPVFSNCCGPYGFGPRRFTPPPCKLSEIPTPDIVIISHNHYDHLDVSSVRELHSLHPNLVFFVPLGNKSWFESSGIKGDNVVELDWWEERDITVRGLADVEGGEVSARISCLPCQHNANRSLNDMNHTLWASWSVSSAGKSAWFGGDTGYRSVPKLPNNDDENEDSEAYKSFPTCPAFAQIGQFRGPFDVGFIPIGAYKPRKFFSCMHATPREAVTIFKETGCRNAFGIHWGTWILTDEPAMEPVEKLKIEVEAAKERGEVENDSWFGTLAIGESREF